LASVLPFSALSAPKQPNSLYNRHLYQNIAIQSVEDRYQVIDGGAFDFARRMREKSAAAKLVSLSVSRTDTLSSIIRSDFVLDKFSHVVQLRTILVVTPIWPI
jgi:hypothetical protein